MSLAAASQTTSTIDTGDLTERASTSNGNEVSDQHSKQKINFGICGSFDLLDDDDLNDSGMCSTSILMDRQSCFSLLSIYHYVNTN